MMIQSDSYITIPNAQLRGAALLTIPIRLYNHPQANRSEALTTNDKSNSSSSSCFEGGLILAHGLGSANPQSKSHSDDEWVGLLEGSSAIQQRVRYLSTYTARGHGNSSGWEETAESNPLQFTWRDLAQDMIAVYEYIEFNLLPGGPTHSASTTMKKKVIFGGSSMGAATALYACIEQPDITAALILIRPPTAWKEREARRKYLIASAQRLRERSAESSKYHFVLSGAMLSDLPMIAESMPNSTSHDASLQDSPHASDLYDKITCPVLILTIEGMYVCIESVHPFDYDVCMLQVTMPIRSAQPLLCSLSSPTRN